jgi:hypothetical protein
VSAAGWRTEGLIVVFDGGQVDDPSALVLARDELRSCAFVAPDRLREHLPPVQARRALAALRARDDLGHAGRGLVEPAAHLGEPGAHLVLQPVEVLVDWSNRPAVCTPRALIAARFASTLTVRSARSRSRAAARCRAASASETAAAASAAICSTRLSTAASRASNSAGLVTRPG